MLVAEVGAGETGERGIERAGARGAAWFSPVRTEYVSFGAQLGDARGSELTVVIVAVGIRHAQPSAPLAPVDVHLERAQSPPRLANMIAQLFQLDHFRAGRALDPLLLCCCCWRRRREVRIALLRVRLICVPWAARRPRVRRSGRFVIRLRSWRAIVPKCLRGWEVSPRRGRTARRRMQRVRRRTVPRSGV